MKKMLLSLYACMLVLHADTRALIIDDYPDTATDAYRITVPQTITGKIDTDTDADVFVFTLDKDDGIDISAYVPKLEGFPDIYLFDYAGNEIASDIIVSYKKEKNVISLNLTKGSYYIKVSDHAAETPEYVFTIKSHDEQNTTAVLHQQTIDYCKQYPERCGIQTLYSLDRLYVNRLEQGKWHLVGTTAGTSISVLDNVQYAAIYKDGEWEFYSPNKSTLQKMKEAGYKTFSTLPANAGIWIKR